MGWLQRISWMFITRLLQSALDDSKELVNRYNDVLITKHYKLFDTCKVRWSSELLTPPAFDAAYGDLQRDGLKCPEQEPECSRDNCAHESADAP